MPTYRWRYCLITFLLGTHGVWALGATYFVANGGNDTADGLSPETAWQSVARVNATELRPGDEVLFAGGETFAGGLILSNQDSGLSGRPVRIGSFGDDKAVLSVPQGDGVFVENCAQLSIENLRIRGPGRASTTSGHGVLLQANGPEGERYGGITLRNLDVSGFFWNGVTVSSANDSGTGFSDLLIESCITHDNGLNGIELTGVFRTGGAPHYGHQRVVIRDCIAFGNTGRPGYALHSGSGIVIAFTDGGLVERCKAHNNGALNDAPGRGPAGIWTWESKDVIVQYCESHHNETNGGDGGGFAIHGGSTNVSFQYNYSHENAGAGFGIFQFPFSRPSSKLRVLYNVSQGDGQKRGGGFHFDGSQGNGGISDVLVAQNVAYVSATQNGAAVEQAEGVAGDTRAAAIHHVTLINNVFLAALGKALVRIAGLDATWNFQHNAYFTYGEPSDIEWGSASFSSVPLWFEATGQSSTNVYGDPLLRAAGAATTMQGPFDAGQLAAYFPLAESPLIDMGAPIPTDALPDPPTRDLAGNPLRACGPPDIGAFEYFVDPDSDDFAIRYADLAFDTFGSVLAGEAPGRQFYYPGYYEYQSGSPGRYSEQDGDSNGIPECYEFALLSEVLLSDEDVRKHYASALAYHKSIWVVDGVDYSHGAYRGIAAMDTISSEAQAFTDWTSGTRIGPYRTGDGLEPLSATGDYDGDGLSNREEYLRTVRDGGNLRAYALAAAGRVP